MDFIQFANEHIETYKSSGQYGTYDKVGTILNKLKTFVNNKRIGFMDIDVNFLYRYEMHLRNELGNKTNTVHSNLKFIRRLFNAAFQRDLIEYNKNPF